MRNLQSEIIAFYPIEVKSHSVKLNKGIYLKEARQKQMDCTEAYQNVNLGSMPIFPLKAKRSTTKAKKFFKYLSLFTFHLSLIFILSGCTAVGSNKPAALQVTSVPEASVFLDGKHLGKTPFFSDQIKSGEHLLKITASEASFVNKVILTSGTLTVVNRELANNFLAQSGETLWLTTGNRGLFVSSMPPEADLVVDGRLIGKTPALIEDIKEGDHKIGLSKESFIERQFEIKTQDKYQLLADVTLASETAKETKPQQASVPTVQKLEVLSTPVGFLRVRKDPSLTASEIGRVKTGDQLEIIQETKDWVKVKFEDKQGWISSQYTKKL